MTDHQNPNPPQKPAPPPPPPAASNSRVSGEVGHNGSNGGYSGGPRYPHPHPPDATNPDPATLREQWRFAIRQYSRWYSHAWGTAIVAGLSFYALGWIIKGSNPLPSFKNDDSDTKSNTRSSDAVNVHESRGS